LLFSNIGNSALNKTQTVFCNNVHGVARS
jgi:hypothetical protein